MQRPGKSGRKKGLVDMSSTQEQPFHYHRPVGAELIYDAPITLDPEQGQSVYMVQWVHKGMTVDFSLTHRVEQVAGDYQHVARYDCCHSEVHKHQYFRDSEDQGRKVLKKLDDPKTAWEDVDSTYLVAYDDMFEDWEENFRRWERGRA